MANKLDGVAEASFNNNDNDFPDKLASTNCAGSQNKICRNDDDNDDIIIAVFT